MLKTEERNPHSKHIDKASTEEMLSIMQRENINAVNAVGAALPDIARAVELATSSVRAGGRVIYVGAGTSGRLGILDAAECPPTFGVTPDVFVGVIAGGERAVFRASENREDFAEDGIRAVESLGVGEHDTVIGISAAGGAQYVLGALTYAAEHGASTVAITSNEDTPITRVAHVAIVTDTGAEVITGSTRMKAGTAQKVVLNMISTSVMIKCGYVYENLMINLKPTNDKLRARVIRIVSELTELGTADAEALLTRAGWDIKEALRVFHTERT